MKTLYTTILFLCISWACKAQMSAGIMTRGADSISIFDRKVQNFGGRPLFRDKEIKPLPPAIYTQNFGFFCRQELKMHNAHVPLSFRLGSMEYCNRLEGK